MTRSRSLTASALAALVLAVLLGWYLLRSAPAAVDLQAAVDQVDGSGAHPEAAAAAGTGHLDGTWTVTTSAAEFDVVNTAGTFVGFRIDEELSDVGATEAIGRTPEVGGSIEFDATTVRTAHLEADLSSIVSDRSMRDRRIQEALNTDEHPVASFVLTEPLELGRAPEVGSELTASARGELTVNGVTQPVTVRLDTAVTEADVIVVTGSFEVDLASFDVAVPSAPIVVSAADVATVELQLYLERGRG